MKRLCELWREVDRNPRVRSKSAAFAAALQESEAETGK
jgi:hypothetical protein